MKHCLPIIHQCVFLRLLYKCQYSVLAKAMCCVTLHYAANHTSALLWTLSWRKQPDGQIAVCNFIRMDSGKVYCTVEVFWQVSMDVLIFFPRWKLIVGVFFIWHEFKLTTAPVLCEGGDYQLLTASFKAYKGWLWYLKDILLVCK